MFPHPLWSQKINTSLPLNTLMLLQHFHIGVSMCVCVCTLSPVHGPCSASHSPHGTRQAHGPGFQNHGKKTSTCRAMNLHVTDARSEGCYTENTGRLHLGTSHRPGYQSSFQVPHAGRLGNVSQVLSQTATLPLEQDTVQMVLSINPPQCEAGLTTVG